MLLIGCVLYWLSNCHHLHNSLQTNYVVVLVVPNWISTLAFPHPKLNSSHDPKSYMGMFFIPSILDHKLPIHLASWHLSQTFTNSFIKFVLSCQKKWYLISKKVQASPKCPISLWIFLMIGNISFGIRTTRFWKYNTFSR
jgi:hypothetical protein